MEDGEEGRKNSANDDDDDDDGGEGEGEAQGKWKSQKVGYSDRVAECKMTKKTICAIRGRPPYYHFTIPSPSFQPLPPFSFDGISSSPLDLLEPDSGRVVKALLEEVEPEEAPPQSFVISSAAAAAATAISSYASSSTSTSTSVPASVSVSASVNPSSTATSTSVPSVPPLQTAAAPQRIPMGWRQGWRQRRGHGQRWERRKEEEDTMDGWVNK